MTKTLLIVGGGSSGWITAAYLNAVLNHDKKQVDITLLESPDIPRISVGEATIPSMKHLLAAIGIDEMDFMKKTNATFKQSIKYVNWVNNDNSFYHHPFSRLRVQPVDRSGVRWLNSNRKIPFMETCSAQPSICEMGRSPLTVGPWNMGARLNYAYHMDAQKFADYLRDFSIKRGVKHILANMTDVDMDSDKSDYISVVKTDQGHSLNADLFVDCTGFRAKLIEEQLKVKFISSEKYLLCNRAVTMHVNYDNHYPGMIRPYTTATAQSNGWIWDIPMQTQRSIGYVHSSDFISKDQAELELRQYQGKDTADLNTRFIDFKVGHRAKSWVGNCIAIGLSNSFIEPLESTGLYLSDLGAVMLAEHFPNDLNQMESLAFRYNRIMLNRYYEILDFINMHYCLTKRTDTDFWLEVQKQSHITERLQAKFEYWSSKPPSASDFDDQCFISQNRKPLNISADNFDDRMPIDTAGLWNHESYECIMYGMHFESQYFNELKEHSNIDLNVNPAILQRIQMASQKLPKHEEWLHRVLGMKQHQINYKPNGWLC